MAESLAERLKRIAAEKKAAAAKVTEPVAEVSSDDRLEPVREGEVAGAADITTSADTDNSPVGTGGDSATVETGCGSETASQSDRTKVSLESDPTAGESASSNEGLESGHAVPVGSDSQASSSLEVLDNSELVDSTRVDVLPEHPLAMQFAELEAALLARDPTFKTILRQVHQHLGKDPELVTMMTEEEVAMIVGGLVLFANTEIVEPAKAKGVKKAVAAAKKVVISADDL
jgi:hypothetical protein